MRILWASHTAWLGGAERCLLEGVTGLIRAGHRVDVILPGAGPLGDHLSAVGAATWHAPLLWWAVQTKEPTILHVPGRAAGHARAALSTLRILRRVTPDLVVTNTVAIPDVAVAAKLAGVPHVWLAHEFLWEHGLQYEYGKAHSLSFINWLSDAVVVNSEAVRAYYRERIPAHKLRLAYLGVQTPVGAGTGAWPSREPLQLVLVGQVAPGKRQEDAIRAVALLTAHHVDTKLTIVGDDRNEYGHRMHTLAESLGVNDRVEFTGKTDPFPHICNAHAALMCSSMEAFGRVTIEAMKLGRPVVGAASGATPELIRDNWNGLLYRVADPEDLAAKIEVLAQDPGLARQLGANAKAWATESFTVDRYARDLSSVFEAVVGSQDRPILPDLPREINPQTPRWNHA